MVTYVVSYMQHPVYDNACVHIYVREQGKLLFEMGCILLELFAHCIISTTQIPTNTFVCLIWLAKETWNYGNTVTWSGQTYSIVNICCLATEMIWINETKHISCIIFSFAPCFSYSVGSVVRFIHFKYTHTHKHCGHRYVSTEQTCLLQDVRVFCVYNECFRFSDAVSITEKLDIKNTSD